MSKATSTLPVKGRANLQTIGRAIWCSILTALPLCGLVLFFELTRPAHISSAGYIATQMASNPTDTLTDDGLKAWLHRGRLPIARFKGISAQQRADSAELAVQMISASDAQRALADASFRSLKAGFHTEFVTKERRRVALLILSREPITDRVLPDNSKLMSITEASTEKVVSFVWGHWLYRAELEDKGVEPDVVVQKVL